MRDSLSLTFLYQTVPGRLLLKLLVHPAVSRAAGAFLSSRASAPLVPYYIRRHRIDMSDIAVPDGGFSSFNAFFTRKRKTEISLADGLRSPCDGFLSCVKIEGDTVLGIKNTAFTLHDLLRDQKLASRFSEGTALVFRLTPANYHRYAYAAGGRVLCRRRIGGVLHCVRPIALRRFPVFAQNSREYEVIRTDAFGTIVQMEIGALLVGRIQNHERPAGERAVCAGQEKGYFEFGGSTILVLLEKNAAHFCGEWTGRRMENGEIPVKIGELLAACEKPL